MQKLTPPDDWLARLQRRHLLLRPFPLLLVMLALLLPLKMPAQTAAPPATEDEARLQWCIDSPHSAECSPGPGVAPLPPCWPSNFGGTGTLLASGMTDKGNWHGWWCPVDGKWVGVGVVTTNDWLVRHPREPRATLQQMAAAYWALNVFEPASAELKQVQAEMWATLNKYPPQDPVPEPPPPPPPPPPAERWLVAPIAGGTRATYRLVDGRLLAAEPRATAGQPCDCQAKRFINAAGTWCAAPGKTELMTLCRKEP